MTGADDYRGDMTWGNEISREMAEAVHEGTPGSSTVGGLVGVLDEIRREADSDQSAFIATFARVAAAAAATSVVAPVIAPEPRTSARTAVLTPVRRITASAASAVLIVASLAGVAVAADHSGPGDILYGLDRALEAVGIGSGGSAERLEEVKALVADGEVEDGLSHAGETLDSTPANEAARNAIADATTRVHEAPDSASTETTEKVASLLDYLANNRQDLDPTEVVSRARDIGPSNDDPGPGEPPTSPPSDPPGSETGSENRTTNPPGSRP